MKKSIELETAIKAAKEAGKILYESAQTAVVVEKKDRQDICTDADLKSEKKIIEILEKQFPEHNIVSEEKGRIEKESEFTWIIDPLDGTKNYIRGMTIFTVSIALAKGSEIILGAVFEPATGRMYYAEKGKGAFVDGQKMKVSKISELEDALVYFDKGNLSNLDKNEWEKVNSLQKSVYRIRDFGLGSLALCYLALGGYDAYIGGNTTKIMDIAAGIIIAQEAGAKISDQKGGKINLFESRKIIASNGLLDKQLLKIFE